MAARSLKPRHQDDIRQKIQASQLVNRLCDHAFGRVEMSATQLKAAEILLRKCVPDLSSVEVSGELEHRYAARVPDVIPEADKWEQQHSPLRTMQ